MTCIPFKTANGGGFVCVSGRKEPEPMCPWCGELFDTWALAKPHVKHCYKAPHQRKLHEPRMTPKKNPRQGRLFE